MFRRISVLSVLFIIILSVSACGDVKQQTLSQENRERVIMKVKGSDTLTADEKDAFVTAMERYAASGGVAYQGKTVGQIIDAQKGLENIKGGGAFRFGGVSGK